jgi:hypothetical protein
MELDDGGRIAVLSLEQGRRRVAGVKLDDVRWDLLVFLIHHYRRRGRR